MSLPLAIGAGFRTIIAGLLGGLIIVCCGILVLVAGVTRLVGISLSAIIAVTLQSSLSSCFLSLVLLHGILSVFHAILNHLEVIHVGVIVGWWFRIMLGFLANLTQDVGPQSLDALGVRYLLSKHIYPRIEVG